MRWCVSKIGSRTHVLTGLTLTLLQSRTDVGNAIQRDTRYHRSNNDNNNAMRQTMRRNAVEWNKGVGRGRGRSNEQWREVVRCGYNLRMQITTAAQNKSTVATGQKGT